MEQESAQSKLIQKVIEPGYCVSCGACVGLCPYFAYYNGTVVIMDRCNRETGTCIQVCPRIPYERKKLRESLLGREQGPLGTYCDVFAVRAKDPEVRDKGQYGGTVSALLILALERRIIRSAILTGKGDRFSPSGTLARSKTEILSCAGSRYSASGTLATLNQEIKEGKKGIAVVGLPCQMESIARRDVTETGEANLDESIALKIGIFCTWALDYRSLRRFLLEKGIRERPKKYDIPPPPAEIFTITTDNGIEEFPLSEIRKLVKTGCSLCEDMTGELADISVGAVEGRPCWNLVFVRNDRGAHLMELAISEEILEVEPVPQEDLAHLIEAARNKKKRAQETQKALMEE